MRRSLWATLLCGAAACAANTGADSAPLPAAAFRPEDRVVIGNALRVNALAGSFDRIFVAFPTMLGIYRPLERRWEVPRTPPDPSQMAQVITAIADPFDRSVWLATPSTWLHFIPEQERWESGPAPGRVSGIAINDADPTYGAWLRVTSGWVAVSRSGGVVMMTQAPRALRHPTTLEDAMRDMPQLRALAPSLLVGRRLQSGSFTSAVPATGGGGWFLGSTNRGLLLLDQGGAVAQPIAFGLPGDDVGALAVGASGVWVATDADLNSDAGLTLLPFDLDGSRTVDGSGAFGLPFDAARALALVAGVTWVGTGQGVVRVGTDGGLQRFDQSRGLPDSRVLALADWQNRLVVGTMRGLAVQQPDRGFETIGADYREPINDLLGRGDTLWVGTDRGLFAVLRGDSLLRMPEGFRRAATGLVPVLRVGYLADTLAAMTGDQLVWRDPVNGAWTGGPLLSGQLGSLVTMTPDRGGFWIAGTRGVGFVTPRGIARNLLQVPFDLPSLVTALVVTDGYLWVGTRAGLVRVRLSR